MPTHMGESLCHLVRLDFNDLMFQVRWGDSYDGYGEHYWEYNHGPSYDEPAPYKEPPKPYSPPAYVTN